MTEIDDTVRVAVLRELLADADADYVTALGAQDGHYGQLDTTVARRVRTWVAFQLEALGVDDIPRLPPSPMRRR